MTKTAKPKYRTLFIKRLLPSWSGEFPFITPAKENIWPYRSSSSIFTLIPERTCCGKYIHLDIFFSPKRAGEFTVDIAVSDTEKTSEKTVASPVMLADFEQGMNGCFRIGQFMNERFNGDWWWALKDNDGEEIALYKKAGLEERFLPVRSGNKWIPSSYDQPIDKIVDEALASLNDTLRQSVFPRLLR